MNSKRLANIFSFVLILTIVTQLLSVLRTSLLAAQFGISGEMDAFNLANLIMVCVINIVGSAIPSIMIPFLAKMKNDFHDKRTLNTYVSTILGSGFLLMLLTFAVGFVLVQVFQLKDSNPFYYMTYLMLVIMGFGQFFRMITWVQTSYLQMDSKFISVKLVGALSVLASYLYLLFKPDISIYEVAISISFSFVLETIGLIMANRNRKYRFHLTINFKDKEYRRLIRLTIPAVLSSTIYQFSILIPNFAGGYFGEGYISTMTYANQISSVFQTLIILNLLSMLYPNLSRGFAASLEEGKRKLAMFMTMANLIVIPLAVGIIVLGPNIIRILFQRGNFTEDSTMLVWYFVIFLAIALPINVGRELVFKSFYSIGDTKTPVINSVICIGLQIAFLIFGIWKLGIITLIVSPLVVSVPSLILGLYALSRKIGLKKMLGKMIGQQFVSTINACVMGVAVYFTLQFLHFGVLIETGIGFVVGVVVYGLLTLITQKQYLKQLKTLIR